MSNQTAGICLHYPYNSLLNRKIGMTDHTVMNTFADSTYGYPLGHYT